MTKMASVQGYSFGGTFMAAIIEANQIVLDPEKSYEVVNGHPEEKEMPGARHAVVAANLIAELVIFLRTKNLGVVCTEANFKIGENERIPDISFVSAERLPTEGVPEGVWPIPPDLAIEIISPKDIHQKISGKTLEYLHAGVRQVWIVSPEEHSVTIFRSQIDVQIFAGEMELVSEDLLPGFRCPLKELFPGI
jgi:Uma2 family endonuclease